ncbi:MAG: hypothetical protein K2M12_05825, partial [Muribaculaceae bacterium]|nr:hypothetical protein [Muribaculaceae bacterium]
MKRFLSCVLVLLTCLGIMAQEHYVFRKLNIANGLSNNNVKTILKDSSGYLWVGTAAGLNRYDGYGARRYVLGATGRHDGDYVDDVLSLQEDGDGNIWVGASRQYSVYNSDKDDFSTDVPALLASYGIEPGTLFTIYVDSSRNLWVLTNTAIYCYDMKQRILHKTEADLNLEEFTPVVTDGMKNTYVLKRPGEIKAVNKRTMNLSDVEWPDGGAGFHLMYADSRQGLWLYSLYSNDIFYLPKTGQWEKLSLPESDAPQSKGICRMLDDGKGNVWIGTDHNGIFIYDQQLGTFTPEQHRPTVSGSLPSNNVVCLYQDDQGTMWLGHNKMGMSYCNNDLVQFLNLSICRGLDVSALLSDRQGNVWIGTDGDGLYVLRPGAEALERIPQIQSGAVVCLEEDNSGKIWVGCYRDGLYCIDRGSVVHFMPANSDLAADMVWDLYCDRLGNLWIATLSGVQYLEPGSRDFKEVRKPEGHAFSSMCVGPAGEDTLYVGSFEGLYTIDAESKRTDYHFTNRRGTQSLKQGFVSHVYRDRSSRLWIGHNHGMTVWDTATDSMYYIDVRQGLCDNIIRSIREDDDGHVYVSTSNGLSIVTPQWGPEAGDFAFTIRNFTGEEGLRSTCFNNEALALSPDSEAVLYGTADGCVAFYPDKMFSDETPHTDVHFTDLFIGNRRVDVDSVYN